MVWGCFFLLISYNKLRCRGLFSFAVLASNCMYILCLTIWRCILSCQLFIFLYSKMLMYFIVFYADVFFFCLLCIFMHLVTMPGFFFARVLFFFVSSVHFHALSYNVAISFRSLHAHRTTYTYIPFNKGDCRPSQRCSCIVKYEQLFSITGDN